MIESSDNDMASEAVRLERSEPGLRERFGTWFREYFGIGQHDEAAVERAVAEGIESGELTSPYPPHVSDAVIDSLDRSLRLDEAGVIDERLATGFMCENRPTLILVAQPVVAGMTTYRAEIQEAPGRLREMELTVMGEGDERQLMEATVWYEQHILDGENPLPLIPPVPMDQVGLLKLAGDLEGRVREGTFVSVEPAKNRFAESHGVAPRLSAGPEPATGSDR